MSLVARNACCMYLYVLGNNPVIRKESDEAKQTIVLNEKQVFTSIAINYHMSNNWYKAVDFYYGVNYFP